MQALLRVIKWIASHLCVRVVDQNHGEGKPHPTAEIGIKGTF